MKDVVRLDNVSIGYGNRVVTADMNAALDGGSMACLIGRNGVGKSTLMRTIARFLPALSGTVSIGGKPLADITPVECSRLVSIVLTTRTEVQNMSVHDMVAMGRMPYTGFWGRLSDDDEARVTKAMRLTGTEQFADRMTNTLSDGERQKVMIAKALAQDTPLMLLDEPTAFLDYPSKVDAMLMLQRLCEEEGKAVLVSTHDLDVALKYATNVWMMQDGRLLTGTVESLDKEIHDFMKPKSCSL